MKWEKVMLSKGSFKNPAYFLPTIRLWSMARSVATYSDTNRTRYRTLVREHMKGQLKVRNKSFMRVRCLAVCAKNEARRDYPYWYQKELEYAYYFKDQDLIITAPIEHWDTRYYQQPSYLAILHDKLYLIKDDMELRTVMAVVEKTKDNQDCRIELETFLHYLNRNNAIPEMRIPLLSN